MIKGVLDYHAINKDVFAWRMATVYKNPSLNVEQVMEDMSVEEIQEKCGAREQEDITPEQKWQLEYKLDRIVKDKIDERYAEIVAKKRDIDLRSMPFEDVKYVLQSIVKPPFDTVEFDEAYRQAVIDSLKKTTGFLRVNLYNKEVNQKFTTPTLNKTTKRITLEEKENKFNDIYTRIERIDPETVFVDNLNGEVNEMFVITPYQPNELMEKFGIDAKYFVPQYTDQEYEKYKDTKANQTYILPESVYHYHLGEKLVDVYEMGDIGIDEYWCPKNAAGEIDYAKTIQPKNCSVHLLEAGMVNNYFDGYSYSTAGLKPHYMLTEYYNKKLDIYVIYCGNVLLYEGRFLDVFGDFPVKPIYTYRKGNSFYGDLFSENLSHEQDRYNQLLHQQELSSIIMDKPTIVVGTGSLDNDFHPYGNINLKKNSPYNEIHLKKPSQMTAGANPNPLQPLAIPNYTNDVLEGRKNTILATIERRYPSLKSLAASNSVEVQKEIIYSRDMATNEMIDQISIALSLFASTVFNCRIFEYQIKQLYAPLKTIDGSLKGEEVNIQETEKDRLQAIKERTELLNKQYLDFIEKSYQEQIKNPTPQMQSMIQQISDEQEVKIATELMSQVSQLNPEQPLTPEAVNQIMLEDPRIKTQIDKEMMEKTLPMITSMIKEQIMAQNPPPKDDTVYLTKQIIQKLKKCSSGLKFLFDKSLKEKIRAYADMMAMAKPFEAESKFLFNPTNFLKEIVLSCGFDPNTMLVDRPPSLTSMIKWNQTKVNTFFNWESDPLTEADFLNDLYNGQKQYTPEDLLKSKMAQFQQQEMIKAKMAQETIDVKAGSQMAVEGNKQAISSENAQKLAMQQTMAPNPQM